MTHHHAIDQHYIHRLRQFDEVLKPMHREMLAWLHIVPGSQMLDAGCGAGGMTALLAEAVGDSGSVTAVDIEPALLKVTQETVAEASCDARVQTQEGDLAHLSFGDASFDLVWCSRVLHHMPDQVAAARELRRVLKSGGRLALREDGWLMQILPFDIGIGEPGLDTRLNVAYAQEFAMVRPSIENNVPYPAGWMQLLHEAGFSAVTPHSFVFELRPPFDNEQAAFVLRQLSTPLEKPGMRERVSADDQHTLELLTDPHSPHYALKRTDLYFVKVSTLYVGQK